jgi:hypothetical protein
LGGKGEKEGGGRETKRHKNEKERRERIPLSFSILLLSILLTIQNLFIILQYNLE